MKLDHLTQRIDSLIERARARFEDAQGYRRDERIAAAIRERDDREQQDDPMLLQQFFELEERIPVASCDVPRGADGKIYDRTWYRSDRAHIERAQANGCLRHSDRETMRDWCDLYEIGGLEA